MLVGIGWLDPGVVKRWQQGQTDCLETVVRTNPPRISEATKLFRSWAAAQGLTERDALCRADAIARVLASSTNDPSQMSGASESRASAL